MGSSNSSSLQARGNFIVCTASFITSCRNTCVWAIFLLHLHHLLLVAFPIPAPAVHVSHPERQPRVIRAARSRVRTHGLGRQPGVGHRAERGGPTRSSPCVECFVSGQIVGSMRGSTQVAAAPPPVGTGSASGEPPLPDRRQTAEPAAGDLRSAPGVRPFCIKS